MAVVHRGRAAAVATLLGTIVASAWACSSSADHPGELGNLDHDASTTDTGGVVPHEGGGPPDGSKPPPTCTTVDGGCSALANCDVKVDVVKVGKTAPAPAGGTVVAGTYAMTQYSLYTGNGGLAGPTGLWFRETMAFSDVSGGDGGADASDAGTEAATDATSDALLGDGGGLADASPAPDGGAGGPQIFDWQDIAQSDTVAEHTLSGSADFSSPAAMNITLTCPSAPEFFASYTSSGGKLIVYVNNGSQGVGEITYTKQ